MYVKSIYLSIYLSSIYLSICVYIYTTLNYLKGDIGKNFKSGPLGDTLFF